jgi:hypothetical protein
VAGAFAALLAGIPVVAEWLGVAGAFAALLAGIPGVAEWLGVMPGGDGGGALVPPAVWAMTGQAISAVAASIVPNEAYLAMV